MRSIKPSKPMTREEKYVRSSVLGSIITNKEKQDKIRQGKKPSQVLIYDQY